MLEKIVLIGGGGHAKVVIDAIKELDTFEISGIIDPALGKGTSVLGIPVIGTDALLPEIFEKGIRYAFISVGSIGNCDIREKIYRNLKDIGFTLPVIIHPKAVIARSVKLGEGTFVAAGAVINPDAKIGKNVIINTASSVEHDCIIGDFVHVAPKVILCGGVVIDDEIHIGTGAKIIQYVHVKKEYLHKKSRKYIIPAGSVVAKTISGDIEWRDNIFTDLEEYV